MMWNWLIGVLSSNATVILYEGNPFYEEPSKLWKLAENENITLFGTSAKYIDALRKSGFKPNESYELKSLKCLCSTGSPLSPESFEFINKSIKSDMQIGSISGGTDILSCFVLNNPLDAVISGEIQCKGLGMSVEVFDEKGNSIIETPGELVCTKPFPSMPIMFWNDPDGQKYKNAYFRYYKNIWRHGDWVKITNRGTMVIYGRSDATLNPGGVRIGTSEIYKVVENFDEVLEAIVVGQNWENDVRVILFIKLSEGSILSEDLKSKIKYTLKTQVSPRHVPAKIISIHDIPRTRSGKITELAVRDIIHGKEIKNSEALSNPEALELYRNLIELKH
jgi:acetoacetyl-CoA synthetase